MCPKPSSPDSPGITGGNTTKEDVTTEASVEGHIRAMAPVQASLSGELQSKREKGNNS